MKKTKNKPIINNIVAKYSYEYNKPKIEQSKKLYNRKKIVGNHDFFCAQLVDMLLIL